MWHAYSSATDQHAHPRSLIRSYSVRLPVNEAFGYNKTDSIAADDAVQLHRLVWIYMVRARI